MPGRYSGFLCRLLLAGLLALLLTACSEGGEWHEKLAIEVETPEGVKRAHSVLATNS